MTTNTHVNDLKINKLTEAQYDAAVLNGTIDETQLSIITDGTFSYNDLTDKPTTFTGADGTNAGTSGLVIAPAATDNTKFLKGDGTWATVDSLPSQSGNSGKFLTTNGTNASWGDALVNQTNTTNALAIGKTLNTTQEDAVLIGRNLTQSPLGIAGKSSIIIGNNIEGGNYFNGVCISPLDTSFSSVTRTETGAVAIGQGSNNSNGNGASIAIGRGAKTTAQNAIQLGSNGALSCTNSDANTFKVGNINGNFEIMSADGTIPEARLASTTSAVSGQVLQLDSNLDAQWTTITFPTVDQTYNASSTNAQSGVAVASAIGAAISSVYKAAGTVAFASKPSLSSSIEGYVYNITDSFTTTSDFVEGAGNSYPAGTNIVCINTAASGQTAVYKWDVLAGFVDLSGYQTTITGGASSITSNNLTASKALVSDANGKVAASSVTTTELGYVSGVTSAIQTQLNAKQATLTAGTNMSISSNTVSTSAARVVIRRFS